MSDELTTIEVLNKIEDYETTILALMCCFSVLTFDEENGHQRENAKHSMGRRMSKDDDVIVTPDGVVQRTESLGYLIEAKKSFPDDQNRWESVLEQLISYDRVDRGWWTETERIDKDCIILLLHQTRGVAVQEYLEKKMAEDKIVFSKPLSLVEFNRSQERIEFMFLRKRDWGEIDDEQIEDELKAGVPVTLEKVIANPDYGNPKFYDAPPVEEHTMLLLWQNIFNSLRQDVDRDEDKNVWQLRVNVAQLTQELQRLYGTGGDGGRDVAFPKADWVRAALDAFVLVDLAEKLPNNDYVIHFRKLNTDPIEKFSSFRKRRADISEDQSQIEMFEDSKGN